MLFWPSRSISDINIDTDNDSNPVPSDCDPDEALQFFCFSTDSIITTAASPTTSPVATAANSPTVYVQKHIFWLLIVLMLLLMLMMIRYTSIASVSITIGWLNQLDPIQVPSFMMMILPNFGWRYYSYFPFRRSLSIQVSLFCCCLAMIEEGSAIAPTVTFTGPSDSSPSNFHCWTIIFFWYHLSLTREGSVSICRCRFIHNNTSSTFERRSRLLLMMLHALLLVLFLPLIWLFVLLLLILKLIL